MRLSKMHVACQLSKPIPGECVKPAGRTMLAPFQQVLDVKVLGNLSQALPLQASELLPAMLGYRNSVN